MGSKVQNSTFSEHGHVAYQIKENHECSNMVPTILLADTLTLGMGQIGQIYLFQNMGTLNINIKEIRKCSSKVANICPEMPTPSPRPWGWGQKVKMQLFQNMVKLHIKIKENHECSNVVANILPADPPPPTYNPDPVDGISRLKNSVFFQYMVMLLIKLKRITNAATW